MKVGVAGAGTMGQGIAQLAASSGADVLVFDRAPAALAALPIRIESILKRRVDKGQLTAPDSKKITKRIQCTESLAKFEDCNLIIEAVTEDFAVKGQLFKQIEGTVGEDCIIASNTSSLSITSLGAVCKHPQRVIGLHFLILLP